MAHPFVSAIKEMREIDQNVRFSATPGPGQNNYLVYLVDLAHGTRIRGLIEEFGYPTSDMVGKDTMIDFWLVVQHQDADLRLQEDCLAKCDFAPIERAFLTDRLRVNKGEPQLYGTQLQRNSDGKKITKPIENSADVDKRRKSVGLPPLQEYLDEANRQA